jgi:hypothetical protein
MYINNKTPGDINRVGFDLSNIVEGSDIFNSRLLYNITKYPYDLNTYSVEVAGMSPNSVARVVYGDQIYSWILILFNPRYRTFRYPQGIKLVYPDLSLLYSYIKNQ